jgi:prolyl oligopeptidase PreP (S9A serine peptidase family)
MLRTADVIVGHVDDTHDPNLIRKIPPEKTKNNLPAT